MMTAVSAYKAASDQSRFSVQAFAGGMLASFAHNPRFTVRTFSATLEFDPESPAGSSIELTVDANSLWLTDDVKPSDRQEIERAMRSQVLETEKYPQVAFASTEIAADKVTEGWFRLRIKGDLMLHGITDAHAMEATLRMQERRLRLTGETIVRLSDFRMKTISALAGTITLKDEVKLSFDLLML